MTQRPVGCNCVDPDCYTGCPVHDPATLAGSGHCDSCGHTWHDDTVHGFEVEITSHGQVILGVPNGEDYRLTGKEAEEVAYLILRAAERSAS